MAHLRAGPEDPITSEMSPASRARQPQYSLSVYNFPFLLSSPIFRIGVQFCG
jgi:hypothetical protein